MLHTMLCFFNFRAKAPEKAKEIDADVQKQWQEADYQLVSLLW